MSKAIVSKSPSIARLTSTGTALPRRVVMFASASPAASTGTSAPAKISSGWSRAARSSRPVSRTAALEPDGATIATRWPRAASCSAICAIAWLTSWPASHAYGVTWAMVSFVRT